MTHHPIRDTWIETYEGENNCLAIFRSHVNRALSTAYPVVYGDTKEEARAKAEAWRQEVIAKHEAPLIARAEAARKAKAKAAKAVAA